MQIVLHSVIVTGALLTLFCGSRFLAILGLIFKYDTGALPTLFCGLL